MIIKTIVITLFIIFAVSYLFEMFWTAYFDAKKKYEEEGK